MADEQEVLIKFWADQRAERRHAEDQRATVTNLILFVVLIVSGFIAQKGLSIDALPLTILLILLGIYGALITAKLHERSQFAVVRMRYFRKRIDELNPNAQIMQIIDDSNSEHKKKYPRFEKIRLHRLWTGLHVVIACWG